MARRQRALFILTFLRKRYLFYPLQSSLFRLGSFRFVLLFFFFLGGAYFATNAMFLLRPKSSKRDFQYQRKERERHFPLFWARRPKLFEPAIVLPLPLPLRAPFPPTDRLFAGPNRLSNAIFRRFRFQAATHKPAIGHWRPFTWQKSALILGCFGCLGQLFLVHFARSLLFFLHSCPPFLTPFIAQSMEERGARFCSIKRFESISLFYKCACVTHCGQQSEVRSGRN